VKQWPTPTVDNKAFEDLGISPGNIICLKDAVIPWYNGPFAKKQRIVSESGAEGSQGKKPLVAYEKRWFDTEGNQTGGNFSGDLRWREVMMFSNPGCRYGTNVRPIKIGSPFLRDMLQLQRVKVMISSVCPIDLSIILLCFCILLPL
jgi:hypothetical protein